ncbi:hypothetical protein HUT19_29110 [Streptomyces sp. NA02950]|uniref:hypothetical protein n=1 Tax=Streptomyces sp. NA02950 TaxID=2742137 RepID=UPI001591336E|nr:hypothetical protein [Streptomyces sp. NA02950]QKV95288.1 hypothetical protein HUT19_29110 [Streptomyces sp. NA02950]
MRSLPLTLAARLVPVAVLAAAGVAMTAAGDSDAQPQESAASPKPSAPATGATTAPPRYPKAPAQACATLPADTVKKLVPGAAAAGNELRTSDVSRRTGCSWHALDDYDYRWLDVAYDVVSTSRGGGKDPESAEPLSGLGDRAWLDETLTTEDGQRMREAVVTVRVANATVTVTYNGSDFGSHQAPPAAEIREGAVGAAKKAVAALDG